MPQKIRQIKNNLRRKIHDNIHKDSSKRNTFEADQYFNPPVILIGNKADDDDQSGRQVDQKTAHAKAQELGLFISDCLGSFRPYLKFIFTSGLLPVFRELGCHRNRKYLFSNLRITYFYRGLRILDSRT